MIKNSSQENWQENLFKEIREKLNKISGKKRKESLWRKFIKKQISPAITEKFIPQKVLKETYPQEFEEFLNSAEMQLTLLVARLKAFEKLFIEINPHLKEKLQSMQEKFIEEIIAWEWFAYKTGKLSSSDFYEILETPE